MKGNGRTRAETAAAEFARYKADLRAAFRELAAQHTRDERKQRQIVEALIRTALRWRRGGDVEA